MLVRSMKAAALLTLGTLVAAPPSVRAQDVVAIVGSVVDGISGDPVSGAEVTVDGGVWRASTGADGLFRIGNLRPDTYTVQVARFGYESITREGVAAGGAPLAMVLTPAALTLSQITVSPGTFSFGGRTPSARQTMTRADIESVPQFAEDIFRVVNRLPGLTSGDFTSRFSIRGGRPDETLIRLDGLEIYEPYHLKDFNDGAISIIDSEAIGSVELMTGGFPVRHGNYTSGVFTINTREPEDDRTRYGFGLSLINARAMAEGTFADGRGSFFVSGRRGYLDLVLKMLQEGGVPSPAYHDVLGKVKYRITPNQSLALNVLQASDRWSFDAQETTGFLDDIPTLEDARNRYGNAYAWLTHEALIGARAFVTTIASLGSVTSRRDGGEYYAIDSSPIYDILARRDFSVVAIKQDWVVDLTDRLAIELGGEVRALDADYAAQLIVTQDPDNPYPDPGQYFPVTEQSSLKRSGSTLGTYLAARWRLASPLTVELGGRYDRASYTGDRDLSPRVNALLELGDATNLRLGWGVFRQMQGIGDLSILDPTQRYYGSERSRQWTASLEHFFEDGSLFRLEAYRKLGDSLRPVYRNFKGGLDVFPESNEDRILVHPINSLSRGIEAYHQRNFGDRLSLRASYALAEVDETVSGVDNVNGPLPLTTAPTHGSPADQRHAVNVDVTYRPWQSWSMTGSFSFHTGWPGTAQHTEDVAVPGGGTETIIVPDAVYGIRLPSYWRIDARLTKRTGFRGGDLRLFIEVSNLTNRNNVFGYDYFRAPTTDGSFVLSRAGEGGFVIVPSIGVSWTGWR